MASSSSKEASAGGPERAGPATVNMGMFDHVVVLDEILRCPHGHRVQRFQTKSFSDPAMDTYLLEGPRVHLVSRGSFSDAVDAVAERWVLDGSEAVFQQRHAVETIVPPAEILFYTACDECTPVLIRSDHARAWGDLVDERQLWVEFLATFGRDGQRQIDRTSGTRGDLMAELRGEGLRVMRDDEPLAIAHCETQASRRAAPSRRRGSKR